MTDPFRPTRAALVVNTASRRGADAYDDAHTRLVDLGVPLEESYPVTDASRLSETVEHLVADGIDLVVVGGGDGTVSSVVDVVAGSDAVLGVLPLGTANDLARTLELPTDLAAACETIAQGVVVDIDLGRVGGLPFLNVASLGLSVGVTRALSPVLKRRLGPIAYPLAAVKAYRSHQPFSAELVFPAGDHETVRLDDLLQVAVGNGRYYGGGNAVSPTAGIDDHLLDVYAITRAVEVRTDPDLPINVDGEVVTSTPQTFTVDRNALDVIVPAASTAARADRHDRVVDVGGDAPAA